MFILNKPAEPIKVVFSDELIPIFVVPDARPPKAMHVIEAANKSPYGIPYMLFKALAPDAFEFGSI